jgi:peptide/nickel transport system ATP-binding protein
LLQSFYTGQNEYLTAVNAVDLEIRRGELMVLAGQSGCGKSTLGLLLTMLERPTSGAITFEGTDITKLSGAALKQFRRKVQMVFQDPYESLNPRYRVEDAIREPLEIHGIGKSKNERREIVAQTLERVELRPVSKYLRRFPHELSGGERQRVAIARAVVLGPSFLVADEPVSMLDVSVRAGILNLMLKLKAELNMTCLFITHDLSLARYISERLAVMFFGRIVEIGPTDAVLKQPTHPYTQLLMRSILIPDPTLKREGAGIDPLAVEPGTETPADKLAQEIAALRSSMNGKSEFVQISPDHFVATHPELQAALP